MSNYFLERTIKLELNPMEVAAIQIALQTAMAEDPALIARKVLKCEPTGPDESQVGYISRQMAIVAVVEHDTIGPLAYTARNGGVHASPADFGKALKEYVSDALDIIDGKRKEDVPCP